MNMLTDNVEPILKRAGCPDDLMQSYCMFLHEGRQDVQIVRKEISSVFQKHKMHCLHRHMPMEGSVIFERNKKEPSVYPDMGLYIGLEYVLCCINNGIPAYITECKRIRNVIESVTIVFGLRCMPVSF